MKKLLCFLVFLLSVQVSLASDVGYGCSLSVDDIPNMIEEQAARDLEDPELKGLRSFTVVRESLNDMSFSSMMPSSGNITVEGYLRPTTMDIFQIAGIAFTVAKRQIVYFCLHMDKYDVNLNHLTLYFLKGKRIDESKWNMGRGPVVNFSPMRTELRPVTGVLKIVNFIMGKIPILGWFTGKIKKGADIIGAQLHEVISKFGSVGVERVVITPKDIDLAFGVSLIGQDSEKFLSHSIEYDSSWLNNMTLPPEN